MFKMSEKSREFLEIHCPELLKEKDLREFQLKLDDFITREGLDENDDMTEFGHEVQAIYDEIYMCN